MEYLEQKFFMEVTIEDGVYQGNWGGYFITFIHNNVLIQYKTKRGIRTPNCRVTFEVKDNKIVESTITQIRN